MQFTRFRTRALLAAALTTFIACSDSLTGPEVRSPSETKFLHVTYDYPKLASTTATFWAVKGRASSAELWYHARLGASDSARFMAFSLGAGSLDRRPDGSVIAAGDSVQITVTVTDPTHMIVAYAPSGLTFSPADQPLLTMSWVACGDDVNYDGKVDSTDDSLISQLNIWRQENPGESWYKQPSAVARTTKEVTTRVGGFSGYAFMF